MTQQLHRQKRAIIRSFYIAATIIHSLITIAIVIAFDLGNSRIILIFTLLKIN